MAIQNSTWEELPLDSYSGKTEAQDKWDKLINSLVKREEANNIKNELNGYSTIILYGPNGTIEKHKVNIWQS